MLKSKKAVERRNFLKGAALGGVATLAANAGALGAQPFLAPAALPADVATESSGVDVLTTNRPGSDFMVDVIKSLGFEYLAANPGSSFRGLHESIINYGGNKAPEFITCCHEESSVAIAQGYAEVEGKPMLVLAHSTVGCSTPQWGFITPGVVASRYTSSLGIASTPRSGVLESSGTTVLRMRRLWFAIIRSGTIPPSRLPHFAESAVRAYKISMTLPMSPVVYSGGWRLARGSHCQRCGPAHS